MILNKAYFLIKYLINAKSFIFLKIKILMKNNATACKIVNNKSKNILTILKYKINKNQLIQLNR